MVLICKSFSLFIFARNLTKFYSLPCMLFPNLVEIGPAALEKIFKLSQYIFKILLLSSLGNTHLNKLEFLSPKHALCQVWLKMAQWFWISRWKCEKFTDGRQAFRKGHLSFQLTWAKIINIWKINITCANWFLSAPGSVR